MTAIINNNSQFVKNIETNELIKINYEHCEYFIQQHLAMKIGFIGGMTETGLFDSLALPLPSEQVVAEMGHKV